MKIRLLKKEDIKSACKIVKENYPRKNWGKNIRQELNSMFSNSCVKPTFVIAEEKEKIIGFASYSQSWMDYNIYEIAWVNVKPDFQKNGIGTALIDRIIKMIKSKKNARLILLTCTAVEYYSKKFNFKPLDIFNDDGYVLMYLELKKHQ